MTQLAEKLQRALALHQQGDLERAQSGYEEILNIQPGHFDALHLLGVTAGQRKDYQRAATLIGEALQIDPAHAAAYCNRGAALKELRQLDAALASYDRAIALKPRYAVAHYDRGNVLKDLGRFDAALESYERAIVSRPRYADAHYNRGIVLQALKRFDSAVESYDRAIAVNPAYAEAHNNRGLALHELKQYESAVLSYDRAIAIQPGYAGALCNRGTALKELRRFDSALADYDQAIALRPGFAEAYSNRGAVHAALRRFDAALADYDRAIGINPTIAETHVNRGDALRELMSHQAALESFDAAMALRPDLTGVRGRRLYTAMQICDWSRFDDDLAGLVGSLGRSETTEHPFPVLALSGSPSLQRKAAENWVRTEFPGNESPQELPRRPRGGRIRVGYFSADFRDHPVSTLTAELIESHDRSRFEVIAFSFGPDTHDEMRRRMEGAFDRFIDVRAMSDRDIALLARELDIDIAVDLGGFTYEARPGVFAMRAAPLQISYLGYLGTMGADFMDYLIADSTIIPDGDRGHYREKILYLPSYQVNDSKRAVAERRLTREELGLPSSGFVFCCFNSSYKITPAVFDGWMRILARVDGGVLFLYAETVATQDNLRKEAGRRGVDPARLVFGGRLPMPEYLARYGAADLFLDTLPYNAGVTASDALWTGLPVLTCAGTSFAGRVAASLLNAIRLPELVAPNQARYEDMAVELASHPERLRSIRRRLADNRLTTPLFDTGLFTRELEKRYAHIHERHLSHQPIDHVHIA